MRALANCGVAIVMAVGLTVMNLSLLHGPKEGPKEGPKGGQEQPGPRGCEENVACR